MPANRSRPDLRQRKDFASPFRHHVIRGRLRRKALRYYFDLVDHQGLLEDREGAEFANRDQAQQEAKRILARIAADEPMQANDNLRLLVSVRDEHDDNVCMLKLYIDSRQPQAAAASR